MLRANDFRIGNTLEEGTVAEIHQDGLIIHHTDSGRKNFFTYPEVKPVILTEEILSLRYHFVVREAVDRSSYLWIEGLPIQKDGARWRKYSTAGTNITIEYLHELENLYFCLHHREIMDSMALTGISAPPQNRSLLSELRIGNKITGKRVIDHSDETITVLELRQSGVIYNGFSGSYSEKGMEIMRGIDPSDPMISGWIKPLPISHEWLVELGFEPSEVEKNLYRRDRFSVVVVGSQVTLIENASHFGRAFQYVHQLQNLYYAVTGSELLTGERELA